MAQVNTMKLKASNKQAGRKIGGTVCIFLFLLILGLFMALPIYLAVVMSIKPVEELFIFPPKLYAIEPTLENFGDMFAVLKSNQVPFSRYVFNSVFVTITVTVAQCVFGSMAAFVLAKCRFPGCKFLNSVIVIALLYQSNVIYIMQYIVMAELNMIDTYMALIFPSIASPMGLFLMRQSIGQVPDAMIDAAKVDGAGKLKQIWYISIPSIMPMIIIMTILKVGKIFYGDFGLFYNFTLNSPLLYSTTDIIDTYVYRALITLGDVGMSSAAGFYQAVLGFILVVITNYIVNKISPDNALF